MHQGNEPNLSFKPCPLAVFYNAFRTRIKSPSTALQPVSTMQATKTCINSRHPIPTQTQPKRRVSGLSSRYSFSFFLLCQNSVINLTSDCSVLHPQYVKVLFLSLRNRLPLLFHIKFSNSQFVLCFKDREMIVLYGLLGPKHI